MSEKVLFEMRITEDEGGAHVHVFESTEWKARHPRGYGHPPRPKFLMRFMCRPHPHHHGPRREDLREALDSLQSIYDDLYGHPAEA